MQEEKELSAASEFYFQWHLTERCNRACRHCYQVGSPANELALSELLRVVDGMEQALTKWGKRGTLSLTGGEPFLRHDDLHALMERLDRSDNFDFYDILTNGSLISMTEARALAAHPRLRRVQVSLEGATSKTNDAIRGPGSFDSTVTAIRNLTGQGIAVSVMTTVSRANVSEFADIVSLTGTEGVSTLAFERLIPEGSGSAMADLVLSREELRLFFEQAYCIATDNPPVRILLYRPLCALLNPEDSTVGALCSVGNNALTIMPDGTVYPCRRLPIPIGHALDDGFFKIWYGSKLLWEIRDSDNLRGKCNGCDLLAKCRGCRAMAYFTTGDYLAEDPQCWS